ncbi:hypothetical protein V6N13_068313 [Hibiscus sabdariffa]
MIVCLLGRVILPSKNIVGLSSRELIRFGCVRWWRRHRGQRKGGGVSVKLRFVLGFDGELGHSQYQVIKAHSWKCFESWKSEGASTVRCFIIIQGLVSFAVMTILVCWRKLAFPWTTKKEKKYKVGEVIEPQQRGLLPDRLSSSLSSCFQTTPLLIGECLDFPKIGFGHAQLSWITRTNGERTKHSRYHFMRVDFQSCLQGVERTVHIGSCGKNEIISLDSQICDSLENVKVSGKRKREEKNIEVIPSLQISEEFCEIQEGPSTPILGEDTPGFVMADDLHPDHPHFE